MRLLYLTHRLPYPPNRGDKIRSHHFIKELSKHHDVMLLSFDESSSDSKESIQELNKICVDLKTVPMNYTFSKAKGLLALLFNKSISVFAFQSRRFFNEFIKALALFKPDIVIADSSVMADYPFRKEIFYYADFMDVDSEKWHQFAQKSSRFLKWIYAYESKKLKNFEKLISLKAEKVFLVSETEKKRLSEIEINSKPFVIHNGIDLEKFSPQEQCQKNSLLFTGVLDYLPNVDAVIWFCKNIWPQIKQKVPDAQFKIVGANPTKAVKRLKSIEGVVVCPNVPSVQPFMNEAEICVLPIRFSIGLQNKLLEALAMGKPVVATSGVTQGVHPDIQAAVVVANKEEEFVASVVELLKNPSKKETLKTKGLKAIKEHCDWEKNLSPLIKLLSKD